MARLRYMTNARTGDEGTVCNGDLHITGDITVDGSITYDTIDVPLNQNLQGTLTVGVNDTGYDVLFYGAGDTYQWLWDESANGIVMKGTTSHTGNLTMEGTSRLYFHDAGGEYIYASADNALAILSGGTITLTSTTIAIVGNITSTGSIIITPTTHSTFLDFVLETNWVHGTLINADFGGSTTFDSDVVGINLDLGASIVATSEQAVTGLDINLPQMTADALTKALYGVLITAQGAFTLASSGTCTWDGVNITLPNITQSAGSLITSGLKITTGTVTSGTQYGVYVAGGTVTSGTVYGIYVTGGNKLTSGIGTVITDPTIATRGVDIKINAGGTTGWSSGNTCGIRSYLTTTMTGAGTLNDFTAGWFGLKFDTGFTAAGTGMVCAINAEVVSVVGRAAKAVLVLQSVPAHSDTDFSAMSYIYCGEVLSNSAIGSKLLLETDSVESGTSGDLLYEETIRVKLNGSVRFIPVSTDEGTYTTAYPIVSTYSGGIGCYLHVTTSADAKYGLYSLITSTNTSGSVFGVYGDVSWSGVASGYPGLSGVKGRVTVNDDFSGGTNYVYGTIGELAFGSSADIDGGSSVFAALTAVITGSSGTYTSGHICGLYVDNQLKTDVTGLNGFYSLIHMANNNTGAADRTVENAILLFGTHVTNFVQFRGCGTGGMVSASATTSGTSKKIKIDIDGVTYYLNAYTG